jgi:tRNA G37 N-methylase Trm5
VTEQGIKQSFDMTRVMFSRGNISEKIRFGKLVKEGDKILDMYTGIGYYTLPALIHGHASYVYACEWNEHAANALRFNIKDNHVEDRVTVLVGDCRIVAQEHNLVDMFDRVSLGLLPSSEGGWRTAVRALKTASGGWLHIHGNVPVKEVDSWAFWVCDRLLTLIKEEDLPGCWIVLCEHVEKVKSFAPTVSHFVADIFLGLPERHPRGSEMQGATAGILAGGSFCPCPEDIQPPSCALSPGGVLHQEWMRLV